MIWFTSDPHFWHKNVIEYCQRPFGSLEEMHEALIQNWNKVVRPSHQVFVLGDFAFAGVQKTAEILARLNGRKDLVMGNHDWRFKSEKWLDLGFDDATSSLMMMLEDVGRVDLSHFPFRGAGDHGGQEERYAEHRLEDRGGWLLHGHVHNAWKRRGRMLNVGVDVRNFAPVSLDELVEEMKGTE
jgi:calcineurin-like phosphoesterase family protein